MKKIFTLCITLIALAACNESTRTDEEVSVQDERVANIVGEEVSYTADTVTMNGYIAYDKKVKGKRPAVLVVHEWWGHNDYARKRADMLAGLGYLAMAVDMYGDGKQADHPQDAGKFAGMVMSDIKVAKSRFEAAMQHLKSHPKADKSDLAAIGYCFGGSVVLSMANAGYDLDAVAAFHSGVDLPVPPSDELQARVLVANGGDDPFIPKTSIEAFKSAMDSVGAKYTYVSYEGVLHSFTNPDADSLGMKFDLPTSYNEEADEDSWMQLKSLLEEAFSED